MEAPQSTTPITSPSERLGNRYLKLRSRVLDEINESQNINHTMSMRKILKSNGGKYHST